MAPEEGRITITRLRHEAGYWQAHVSVNGDGFDVDRRYGSWQAVLRDGPGKRSFHRTDIVPALAAKLQAKVRPLEKNQIRIRR